MFDANVMANGRTRTNAVSCVANKKWNSMSKVHVLAPVHAEALYQRGDKDRLHAGGQIVDGIRRAIARINPR